MTGVHTGPADPVTHVDSTGADMTDPTHQAMRVNIVAGSSGGSGGSSATDSPGAANFTAGSSSGNPIMAVFNDGLAAAVSGAAIWLRATASRALHVNLRDSSGNEIAKNADGGLQVHVMNGGGGASATDNSAFTAGTTAFTPIGGDFDDTPPATLTAAHAATARITANRALHVNLRTAAGAELGSTAGNLNAHVDNPDTQYGEGFTASLPTGTVALAKNPSNVLHPIALDASGNTLIAGTVTSNIGTTNGLALDATLTGGTAKAIPHTPAKGTTAAGDVTSANVDANTQAMHVQLAGTQASVPVTGTFWQATQPVSGTVAANQGTAAALSSGWPVKVTDGTNTQPTGDANARPIHVELDAQTGTGYTPGTLVAAANNNLTTVKASAGTLGYLSASNNAAYPIYVKVYDGTPTMGTTAAIAQWEIPCNATAANGAGRECHLPPQGLKFSTNISLAVTKGIALTDNTAVAASDGAVSWGFI